MNAGLSEYGFTKLDVRPDGGARAGRTALLELLLLMMPVCANNGGTEVAVVVFHAQAKTRKDEENRWFCSCTSAEYKLFETC